MNKLIHRLLCIDLQHYCCLLQVLFAQEKAVEMADLMRSNGKIYVVVAVCLLIHTGWIVSYML
jgi:hypothetical protein